MGKVQAARESDVPPGGMLHVEVDGRESLMVNVSGEIHAMDDRCGHMRAPLSMGDMEISVVTCPLHGARSDVRDGRRLKVGQLGGVAGAMVKRTKMGRVMGAIGTHDRSTYPVVVEEGNVFPVLP